MKIFGYKFFELRPDPEPKNRYSRIERESTPCHKCENWTRTLVMKNPDQRLCVDCLGRKR